VDESHWPRLLLKSTPNNNDGYWVKKYIVDANKVWSEAKQLFADHFDSFAYKDKLAQDYENIKQHNNETVQQYTDRFSSLIDQLGYDQDNLHVINHYLHKMIPSTYANYRRNMDIAILTSGPSVELKTFKAISDRIIRLEAIELNLGIKTGVPTV
jgi:hypothetical protein